MGLMELGCKLEDFGRLAQPAASNRLRCRADWWCLVDICVRHVSCVSLSLLLPVHGFISQYFLNCFLGEAVAMDFNLLPLLVSA